MRFDKGLLFSHIDALKLPHPFNEDAWQLDNHFFSPFVIGRKFLRTLASKCVNQPIFDDIMTKRYLIMGGAEVLLCAWLNKAYLCAEHKFCFIHDWIKDLMRSDKGLLFSHIDALKLPHPFKWRRMATGQSFFLPFCDRTQIPTNSRFKMCEPAHIWWHYD